ncbi:glycosyltransferase [Croceicoccus sediminis]|uniref:glycosyltransferase n=1 Tax=Croceicoccus sediminis TaxID=2571150 RepID=UPI001182608A|nr:glycosyltransferase [Croceicoccus sediminis]
MIDVAFFVPTLNRNPMVLRAVHSCIAAIEHAGVTGRVIVLDSKSDDGSWEALNAVFGDDLRVELRQNERGLGPTKSWCDNVAGFEAAYATFLWSDDYVAREFLTELLPPLREGAAVAIGHGKIRPAECEEPLSQEGRRGALPADTVASAYFLKGTPDGDPLQVSPACALFPHAAVSSWLGRVEGMSRANGLREYFLWRRAIGPDLLLFFIALGGVKDTVFRTQAEVAQFSAHEGSITISSSPWFLTMGYWLARCIAFCEADLDFGAADRHAIAAELFVQGIVLKRRAPDELPGFGDRSAVREAISREMEAVRAAAGKSIASPVMLRPAWQALRRRMGSAG